MNENDPLRKTEQSPTPARRQRRGLLAGVAIGVLSIGAAAGAVGFELAQRWRPQEVMLLQPTAVSALQDGNSAAVKGTVAEIFGNKFILDDGSGHALVDLGPRGENLDAVTKGETVIVQGGFDGGILHAEIVSHGDGRTQSFGPLPPPPMGPRGPGVDAHLLLPPGGFAPGRAEAPLPSP